MQHRASIRAIAVVFLSLLLTVVSSVAQDVWKVPVIDDTVGVMSDGTLFAFVGERFSADSGTKVWTSRDSGWTWQPIIGTSGRKHTGLTVSDDYVVVLADTNTINLSSDGGRTWEVIPSPPSWSATNDKIWVQPQSIRTPRIFHRIDTLPTTVWIFDPQQRSFIQEAEIPDSIYTTFVLHDGRTMGYSNGFVVEQTTLGTWKRLTKPALPNGAVYNGSYQTATGHLITTGRDSSQWLNDSGRLVLLVKDPELSVSNNYICAVLDSIVVTSYGWYRRTDPYVRQPIVITGKKRVDGDSNSTLIGITCISNRSMQILRYNYGYYHITQKDPLIVKEAWLPYVENDMAFWEAHDGMAAAGSVLVSTRSGEAIEGVVRSFDHGITFHSVLSERCIPGAKIGAFPDGALWMVGNDGCNMLSWNDGTTWDHHATMHFRGDVRNLEAYADGSWTLSTSRVAQDNTTINEYWHGVSPSDKGEQIPQTDTLAYAVMPDGNHYRAQRKLGVSDDPAFERSTDGGMTWVKTSFNEGLYPGARYINHIIQIDDHRLVFFTIRERVREYGHTILSIIDDRSGTATKVALIPDDFVRVALDVQVDTDSTLFILFDDGAIIQVGTDGRVIDRYLPSRWVTAKSRGPYQNTFQSVQLIVTPDYLFAEPSKDYARIWTKRHDRITTVRESTQPEGSGLVCYPNPASTTLTIAGCPQGGTLDIVSTFGNTVITAPCKSEDLILDVSRLSAGVYLLRVTTADTATTYHPIAIIR